MTRKDIIVDIIVCAAFAALFLMIVINSKL